MKKYVVSVLVLLISINVFALGSIEAEYKLINHPLFEFLEWDGSSNASNAFTLKLKNGHEIYFSDVKDDLTFGERGGIVYINDGSKKIYFLNVVNKNSVDVEMYRYLRIRNLCKATGTKYNDVYSILDNYNDFCRLLNTLPWIKDKSAEKVCAKYTDEYCVYLYRGSIASNQENKFIEIPEE